MKFLQTGKQGARRNWASGFARQTISAMRRHKGGCASFRAPVLFSKRQPSALETTRHRVSRQPLRPGELDRPSLILRPWSLAHSSHTLENPDSVALPWKLAAIDIDDTLVDADRTISAANHRAIAELRRLGVAVVLASGRSHANMAPFHARLGLDTPLISANGALVREVTGKVWAQHGMPAPLVPGLIEEGRRRGLSVLLYGLAGVFVDRRTPFTEYDQSRNDDIQIEVPDLCGVPVDGIHKLIWMAEPETITRLTPELSERFETRLTVTHTDPPYLEFMPPGITKATGLADVVEHYGFDARQVVAFGDGNNDVTMLRWAGVGIAMAHAKPAAKAVADYAVPEAPVNESLARGIEWLIERSQNRCRE